VISLLDPETESQSISGFLTPGGAADIALELLLGG
jgi:hypothetical protein